MSTDDLPKVNASHIQSAEAERALEAVLCPPDFIARKQTPDYGTDYDVELCTNSQATNVKFSIQLKSAQNVTVDSEKTTIALQIETSRLAYLSRNPCGALIAVYDAASKHLFYSWVDELIQSLDSKGSIWRSQETVTIHIPLSAVLNKSSAQNIHETVQRLYQKIGGEALSAPTSAISSDKSPDELLSFMEKNGLEMISHGMHREAIESYSSIPSIKWRDKPPHLLCIALAYEHAGLPLQALTNARASLACAGGSLRPEDAALAERIVINSQRNIGQTTPAEYNAALRNLGATYANTEQGRQIALELILKEMVEPEIPRENRRKHAEDLLARARTIVTDASDWSEKLLLARIENQASIQVIIEATFQVNVSIKTRHPMEASRRAEFANKAIQLCESASGRLKTLAEHAKKVKRFDLFATCCLEAAMGQFNLMVLLYLNNRTAEDPPTLTDKKGINFCLSNAKQAAEIFSRLGVSGQALRAQRLEAEILSAAGRKDEAERILHEVRKKAESLGLDPNGFRLTELPEMPSSDDISQNFASLSDQEVVRFTHSMIEAWGIPKSRFENALKDFKATRMIQREKLSWCKHLEMVQDLTHTQSKSTHYAIDPERHCRCVLLGHESRIGSRDPDALVTAFKANYCSDCTKREIESKR